MSMKILTAMLVFLVSLSALALDYGIDRLSEETVAAKLAGKTSPSSPTLLEKINWACI